MATLPRAALGQVEDTATDSKLSFESSFATVAKEADARSLAQDIGDSWIRKEVEERLREQETASRGEEFVPQDISLAFSDSTLDDVNIHVELLIADLSHADGDTRMDAKAQLILLWRLVAPRLIDEIGNSNQAINEGAIKALIEMRDRRTIEAIIERARSSTDENVRLYCVFALGMMNEQRDSRMVNRDSITEDESQHICDELILPYLIEIEAETSDARLLNVIRRARGFLQNPADRRRKEIAIEDVPPELIRAIEEREQ